MANPGDISLDGLIKGKNIEEVIAGIPSKRSGIMAIRYERQLNRSRSNPDISYPISLDTIDCLTQKLDEIDLEIKQRISRKKEDLRIAMPIPGIGFVAATTILTEIGN